MGELHALPDRHSLHFVDAATSSDMRVTSHFDSGVFVVSLWHGSGCVGTAKLEPTEAARLVSHITEGLASLAAVPRGVETAEASAVQTRWRAWLRKLSPPPRNR